MSVLQSFTRQLVNDAFKYKSYGIQSETFAFIA
jgi:hypothetical protein